jgi:AcrR family transcriptional regulator
MKMVKATFTRLPKEKQERIYKQMLIEFSRYPLGKAKVAHIVEGADIARGSFYKYFDDLTDAYRYTLGRVLAPGSLQGTGSRADAHARL